MKEEMDRAQAELNALKRTEEDLKKGHQKLEEMVTRLDQEVVSQMRAWLCISIFPFTLLIIWVHDFYFLLLKYNADILVAQNAWNFSLPCNYSLWM